MEAKADDLPCISSVINILESEVELKDIAKDGKLNFIGGHNVNQMEA